MASPSCGSVARLIIPGTEDCATLMKSGDVELKWQGQRISKFEETSFPLVRDTEMELPNLFLGFLDEAFLPKKDECDPQLRAGGDNSEIQLVLPKAMVPTVPEDSPLRPHLDFVIEFLTSQAEVMPSSLQRKGGGFGSACSLKYEVSVDPGRQFFAMKTARPKAGISIDKNKFGIPDAADMYMFIEHHATVSFMSPEEQESFQVCLSEMSSSSNQKERKFGVFLRVFYEGGFGYNQKQMISEGEGYQPINVGVACMQTTPAFPDQAAICTGTPYELPASFLSFVDTVPVTIQDISSMSEKHARYGFCFTRCVFVWESAIFAERQTLNFCSLLPHGGFYYVPNSIQRLSDIGGLLYAFGQSVSTSVSNMELSPER